jgi:hypothetical protein
MRDMPQGDGMALGPAPSSIFEMAGMVGFCTALLRARLIFEQTMATSATWCNTRSSTSGSCQVDRGRSMTCKG